MLGRALCAAAVAACISGDACAQASEPAAPTVQLEATGGTHFWWTELTHFDDRPKAWDAIVSHEVSAAVRILSGPWEGMLEIGAIGDRFTHFEAFDGDALRAALQLGLNQGDWSYALEWEGFDVFEPGIGDFYIGFNTYDARVSKRFTLDLIRGLRPGLFQASLTGGYQASTFDPLDQWFVEAEIEWVQHIENNVTLTVAPRMRYVDYPHFSTKKRQDAILTLRIAPNYNLREGVTLTLEGEAAIGFSTLRTKSGETWKLTPTIRIQTPL